MKCTSSSTHLQRPPDVDKAFFANDSAAAIHLDANVPSVVNSFEVKIAAMSDKKT